MDAQLDFKAGIKDVMPTVFGYIGVGLAFGIVAHTSHLSVWLVLLMSLIVYAGSAQFVITSMLLTGSPIGAIVVSTLLINARMSLMSMTVAPYLQEESMGQNIAIGTLLTDETFALSMNKLNLTDRKLRPAWFHAANVVAYLVWAIATVIGALIGSLIPDAKAFGLDFAVVAMFIGLLYLQMITDRSKPLLRHLTVAGFVAVMMVVLMRFMPGSTAILVATILGCLFGMAVEHHE
ncbi:AzlC family ABC transporter permease [Lacticaseibacillus manihotivorans]|jgi:4-azaleucine resistance transporter AzlC|uniref:Amino acid permease n=2 Tax=Lacticaseibacillus manihotivorans TaxID=88233 RepID=A0A0R1R252_9LACO|nr:AzlC family ABC transporter permease [Lacticaseibacillus manihotivorans]KRL47395.1 amino acid permease [Lacticaseibacillus manihotivorans DSM 13343 = JCM 12514]QFQ89944.1 branched-chain amino acid ABC transporter permease [Lacticaseibacillus manihotivorans]